VLKQTQEDATISDDLLKRAVEFHGHLGPFLVLGLKAGLLANSLLGKDCFETTAVVATDPNPPHSCLVDGVQFVTGCTMGKGNIKIKRSKSIYVLFLKGGRKLKLKLIRNVLGTIRNASSQKDSEKVALELLKKPAHELFVIEE
jgi:formylmethanofuran dehydrogenase subunit E